MMKKNSIITFLMALFTVVLLSDFKLFNTQYLFPNVCWIFPFFGFYFLSFSYFSKAFSTHQTILNKVLIIFFGGIGVLSLLYAGFSIFKINQGNIFLEIKSEFQLNFKNIFFWVIFQSYVFLFFFSSFKQLVTIDQK